MSNGYADGKVRRSKLVALTSDTDWVPLSLDRKSISLGEVGLQILSDSKEPKEDCLRVSKTKFSLPQILKLPEIAYQELLSHLQFIRHPF